MDKGAENGFSGPVKKSILDFNKYELFKGIVQTQWVSGSRRNGLNVMIKCIYTLDSYWWSSPALYVVLKSPDKQVCNIEH